MNDPLYHVSSILNKFSSLVEFIDANGNPLIIAPITHAPKLRLGYKVVWVCIIDTQRRVYLRRRSSHLISYPNHWDFSASGHVLFGESAEDTALRELNLCFSIPKVSLTSPTIYSLQLEGVPIVASLYTVGPISFTPDYNPEYVQEGMFLDEDELVGFISELPEFLTPLLLWAVRNNILKRKID